MPDTYQADILAIAAHRDDVEQTCGGTLLKMAERGYRTAILDLTRGEMGTRGTVEDRGREADDAGRILKAGWRQALDIPDGRVENTYENKLKVAGIIRQFAPRASSSFHTGRRDIQITPPPPCWATKLRFSPDLPNSTWALRRIGRSKSSMPASTPMSGRHSWSTSRRSSRRVFESLMAYRSQYEDQKAGSGLFSQKKRRSANASPPWPATTACWQVCSTPSRSCRRKSA